MKVRRMGSGSKGKGIRMTRGEIPNDKGMRMGQKGMRMERKGMANRKCRCLDSCRTGLPQCSRGDGASDESTPAASASGSGCPSCNDSRHSRLRDIPSANGGNRRDASPSAQQRVD